MTVDLRQPSREISLLVLAITRISDIGQAQAGKQEPEASAPRPSANSRTMIDGPVGKGIATPASGCNRLA